MGALNHPSSFERGAGIGGILSNKQLKIQVRYPHEKNRNHYHC